MYQDKIQDVIILNFKEDLLNYLANGNVMISIIYIVIIVSFLISSTLTIPLVFFGTKKHFLNLVLFFKKNIFYRWTCHPFSPLTQTAKIGITLFLYFLVLFITLLVENIMVLFNFIGATSASSTSYLLPGFFLIKLSQMSMANQNLFLPKFVLLVGFFGLLSFYGTEIVKLFVSSN